jgi:PAS domain S-box-containing protein
MTDREGRHVYIEIFLSPVFDEEGSVQEVFGIGHEITEQREAEDLAREQGARLQAIFDSSANMMIWTLDRDLHITSCNEHFQASVEEAFGVRFDMGSPFINAMAERVAGGRPERYIAKYQNALKGFPQQFEVELRAADGRSVWVENFLNPIVVGGEVTELSCLAHTITEKKEAQVKLLESLREKEILLKEVHHRVKNNLQVISSILNLQIDHVGGDEQLIALLRDSQARIRSMSYIHESLYQRKNFNSVDIGAYIGSLARNLMMSHSLDGRVSLKTDVDSVELGLDQAIPCGLMINELVSNALKHAFPSGASGEIDISVKRAGEVVRITIADNGIGLPEEFDVERDANLGLQLVSTLIGQVDGRLEREPGPGTRYCITFALAPPRAIA